jgi:hypothetical protein
VRAIGTVTAVWKVAATCAGLSIDLIVPLQGAVDVAACSITQHSISFKSHYLRFKRIFKRIKR